MSSRGYIGLIILHKEVMGAEGGIADDLLFRLAADIETRKQLPLERQGRSSVGVHVQAADSSRVIGNTIIAQQNITNIYSYDYVQGGRQRTDSTAEDERTRGDKQRKSHGSKDDSLGETPRRRTHETGRVCREPCQDSCLHRSGEKHELHIGGFFSRFGLFKSWTGKQMICIAYSNKASVRSANLRLYLANDMTSVHRDLAHSARLRDAELIADPRPFFVKWSDGDVHVAVMNNEREEEVESIRIEEIRSSNQTYTDFAELNTEHYEKLTIRVFQGTAESRISCKNPLEKPPETEAIEDLDVRIPTEKSRERDFDDHLRTVAKQICKEDDIDNLGRKLGFEFAEIARYIQTNIKYQTVTYMGTLCMLRDWRNRTTRSEESEQLKKALIAINHGRLADDLLSDDMAS